MVDSRPARGRSSDGEREPDPRGGESPSGDAAGRTGLRSRRAFLATGATVSLASLVGCLGGGGSTDSPSGDGSDGQSGDGSGSPSGGGTGAVPTTTRTRDYPDEVVIGSVHPFTGSTSYVGKRLHNAVELAAAIKNENGGIQSMGGAEVRVEKGDHKNDPTVGGEVTGELIDGGADVLTGTYSSPVTNAATRTAEAERVPFVIDISVAASLLQERSLEYVYRTQPNSWHQASDHVRGFQAVTEQAGIDIETVGLFYVDTSYGQAIRDGIKRAMEDTDMAVVEEATIGFGGTADTQVTGFREADPDALFPTVFSNQMLELVDAMQNQDYWPKVFAAAASGGMYGENFQKMGEAINGALSSGYQMDMTRERAQEINQRYMNTYDTAAMSDNVAMAYTTGEVIVEAFEQAGSADPDALKDALDEITVSDHVMAMDPITFTDAGENANPLSVTNQVQGMTNYTVFPEEYATRDLDPDGIGRN